MVNLPPVNLSHGYLGSSVTSTEKDIDMRLTKAWTAINRLSIIWKSDLTDKMKHSFFLAAVTSILQYGCTTWTLTKRLEKKLDGNYTRMLQAILNKSWRQHPTRHQLYGHLPPITKTIQVRQTRHAGHCWRSRDELISDVLLWTPTHGRAKAGRPARTYIQQRCEDTGCCPKDLPEAMNDREKWRERVRYIRATSTTWWWWWNLSHGKFIANSSYKINCSNRVSLTITLTFLFFLSNFFKTMIRLWIRPQIICLQWIYYKINLLSINLLYDEFTTQWIYLEWFYQQHIYHSMNLSCIYWDRFTRHTLAGVNSKK